MRLVRKHGATKTLLFVLAASWAVASCSGQGCSGCSCMGPIPGGFPTQERIPNGIQVRITRGGLDFIQDNMASIVTDMMGGSLQFDLPATCDQDISGFGTMDFCGEGSADDCQAQDPPCSIQVDLLGLTLNPQAPSTLHVEGHLNVRSLHTIHTHGDSDLVPDCNVDLDTSAGSHPYVRVVADMVFNQDSQSGRTRIDLENVEIPDGDIDDDDIDITGSEWWNTPTCGAIDLFFKGQLIDQLRQTVSDQAQSMAQSLCMPCDPSDPTCPQLSSCQETDDGTQMYCMEDSTEGCVQNMGTEGRVDMGAVLSSLAPALQAWLDIHIWAGGYSDMVNSGVSQGLFAGTRAWPGGASCVPRRDPPPIQTIPESATFQVDQRPDGGSYHLGIGIHKTFLDRMGYALYDSGALCLDMGPRQSDYLKVSTFSLMLDSLGDLIHSDDPALVISVRPQNPPTFTLGSGTLDADGTILDPLITVQAKDLALDFYGLVDERFIRLFRLVTDLSLPLVLQVNENNQLVPVLGDIKGAFTNLRVEHSELLAESPEEIAAVFPSLLDAAGGALGSGALSPIDLPDMQGFELVLDENSITSTDQGQFLAIFANLQYSPAMADQPQGVLPQVETQARILSQQIPKALHPATLEQAVDQAPKVTLEVQGILPNGLSGQVEWSYRLDGGLWSTYRTTSPATIQRPLLWFEGRHHIEVRARLRGQPQTVDRTPARLEVVVDRAGPTISATVTDRRLSWKADDLVSKPDRVWTSFRFDDGPWSPWSHVQSIQVPTGAKNVTLRAKDESGHVTERVLGLYGRVEPRSSDSGGCGCRSNAPGGGLALLLTILGLFLSLHRKRRGGPGKPDESQRSSRRNPFSRGLLVPTLALTVLGAQACHHHSTGGQNCGDATDIPLLCADPAPQCEAWESLVGTEPMTLDEDCQPLPVPCECEVTSIAEPGDFGRYLSIAAGNGAVLVACYNDTWGDLDLVTKTEDGFVPQPVDGVPWDGPVQADPSGFRKGILLKGDDVGKYTAIALGSDGQARITYLDQDRSALKYAQGLAGNWAIHDIYVPATDNEQVWYSDILLDDSDQPTVFFMVTGLDNADGTFSSKLMMAQASSANPSSSDDWTLSDVDSTQIPCAGLCPSGQVCPADTWTCVAEDDSCDPACAQGQVCIAGSCVDEALPPTWTDHPEGTGLFVTAARLSDGRLVAAYHDRTLGLVRLALQDGSGSWTVQTADGDQYSDLGLYVDMTLGPDDTIHLAYHDAVADALIYQALDPSLTQLAREVADDGQRDDGHHVVGLDPVILLSDDGTLRIIEQDGTDADLLVATRTQDGQWNVTGLDTGDAGYGFYTDVARDSDGTLWIAQYVYDRAADRFGSLHIEQLTF